MSSLSTFCACKTTMGLFPTNKITPFTLDPHSIPEVCLYRVPVLPRDADRAFRGGIRIAVGRVAPTSACEQRRAQDAPPAVREL